MGSSQQRSVEILIKVRDQAGETMGRLGEQLLSINGIAIAAAASLAYMGVALTKVTKAAMEQEDADVRLAIALKSMGQNTEATRKHLENLASQLQDVTGVNDETIQSAIALLAQLGRLSGDGLDRATRAALDLSGVMGTDLESAAMLLAKAAQGSTAALARYGIVLDESIPKSQRFEAALRLIESGMVNTAAAMGQTLSGAMHRVSNAWDDFEQATGKAVIENEAFRAVLSTVVDLLKRATKFVGEHNQGLQQMVTWGSKATLVFLQFGLELVKWEAKLVEANVAVAQSIVGWATLLSTVPTALFHRIFGGAKEEVAEMALAGAHLLVVLEKLKTGSGALATDTVAAIAAIEATLAGLTGKPVKVVEQLGQGAPATTEKMTELNSLLKDLGITTLPELSKQAIQVDLALNQLAKDFEAGKISPEEYDAIFASITQITDKLPQWADQTAVVNGHVSEVLHGYQAIDDLLGGQLTNSAIQSGDAMVDAAFGAKIAWGQFFKQLLIDITKAIVRMGILKLITSFGSFGAAAGAGDAADFGSGLGHAFAGDSLASASASALLTPAQIVFPSAEGGRSGIALSTPSLSTQPGSGAQRHGDFQLLARIEPKRDREAEAIDLLDRINRLVEKSGYRLTASSVLT